MRRALLALPLLLVVAACGGKTQAVTVTALPQPAPLPAKTAAACKASQLRPDGLGHKQPVFQSAGGTVLGTFGLRNVADEPCSLDSLTVRLEPVLVLQTAPPVPQAVGGKTAAAWLGSLEDQRVAGVSLQWTNWCVKGKRPTRMQLVLPGEGGSLTIPAPARTPKCYEVSAPTTVSTTLAPALGQSAVTGKPPLPLDAEIVPPSGAGGPLETRPGGGFNYTVKLTNSGDEAIADPPPVCPLFAQQLSGTLPSVEKLDCSALGRLEPGHSVVYEMALMVTPSTLPGPHTLEWMLDPYSTQTPSATAPVTITAG